MRRKGVCQRLASWAAASLVGQACEIPIQATSPATSPPTSPNPNPSPNPNSSPTSKSNPPNGNQDPNTNPATNPGAQPTTSPNLRLFLVNTRRSRGLPILPILTGGPPVPRAVTPVVI